MAQVTAESICGECGYRVAGLTTFVCPECGSDLREVGIARRREPRGFWRTRLRDLPPQVRRGAWIRIGLTLAAMVATYSITVSTLLRFNISQVEFNTDLFAPRSGAYQSLGLTTRFETRRSGGETLYVQPQTLPLTLTLNLKDGTARSMDVELPGLSARYASRSSNVPRQTVVDRDEVLTWMKQEAGLDTSSPRVAAEADRIMALLKRFNIVAPANWQLFNQVAQDELRGGYTFQGFRGNSFWTGHDSAIFAAAMLALMLPFVVILLRIQAWAVREAQLRAGGRAGEGNAFAMGSGAPAGPRSRVLTVLFSDVEGYTARSGIESREGLVELVRRHRQLAEPLVRRRGGRIIKAMGDGLLAGFDGATDAVLAATQIQEQAARNNRDAFTDRQKLYLRIGISTGEVTVEQDDVYGQAVNLASRAQQVAPAGGVLFTAATLAMLNRAEVRFADAGLFSLKGFDEPVPLYKPLVPAATPDGGANGE